jgi:hypothetical protein
MPPRIRKTAPAAPKIASLILGATETLAAIEEKPEDAALRALVMRYAQTIEDAKGIADGLAVVEVDPEDRNAGKTLAILAAKVDAHQVMVDLGPKLLQALDALAATPKSRAMATGGGASGAGKSSSEDALARLRARPNRAPALDAATEGTDA